MPRHLSGKPCTYSDVHVKRRATPPARGKGALFHAYILCTKSAPDAPTEHGFMLWLDSDHDPDALDDRAGRALSDILSRGHIARAPATPSQGT